MGHRIQTGQRPQAGKQPAGRKPAAQKREGSGKPILLAIVLLVVIVACGAFLGKRLWGSQPKEVDRSTLAAPQGSQNAPPGAMFDPAKMPRKGGR